MHKRIALTVVSVLFLLAIAGTAGASVGKQAKIGPMSKAQAAAEADDEVVLPSRVAFLISRIENSMAKATEHVDEAEYPKAIISLKAVRKNVAVLNKAAIKAMTAAPADPEDAPDAGDEPAAPAAPGAAAADPEAQDEPADPAAPEDQEEAAMTPADTVVAVLALEQQVVTQLADLLNGNTGTLVGAIGTTITSVQTARDNLINKVVGLDPEGAGADYADAMADTVAGYDDEVANMTDALADDVLSAGAKSILTSALAKSKATQAKLNAAFGGGE
jgi:hypothetical protein